MIETRMIETGMHRLATRLGVRDGEAYTIVCGLVVALVLAVVGLPGVFRDVAPAAIDQAAAATPPTSPTSTVEVTTPTADDVTPSLPALAPSLLPSGPAESNTPTPTPPPTTTPTPAPSGSGGRPVGDLVLLAEVPEAGAPDAVAVAPDGTIYVADDDAGRAASRLWAFTAAGAPVDSWAAPGQPADRTRGLTGVAVDDDGQVWVIDAATARVLRLDTEGDRLVPVAGPDDLPACGILNLSSPCESGLLDSAPLLTAIAIAPDGTVVVADRAQGTVWRLEGSSLQVLTTFDDRIAGDGPIGLSFVSDDELIVAIGGRLSSFPPGLPAVLQVRLVDGAADAPVVVADLAVTETPGDLVTGNSGRVYVSVPASGLIADIGIDQGDRIDIVGDGAEASFVAPLGLALRERSLLVTDAPDRIFDLTVDDRPVT